MAIHIPDRSASAADVRRFITDVLVSDYDAEPDFASEAASAWRIGRGAELHDAKERYFVDIFGVEIGVCLHRSVLNAREKHWQNSRIGILYKWAHRSVPILAIWNFHKSQWGRSSPPSFPLFLCGALLLSYEYLRPMDNYLTRTIGLASLGLFFVLLLFGK